MSFSLRGTATVGLVVVIIVGSAAAAQAASKNGTLNCPNYYPTGQLTTNTTGSTRHTWVDSNTGAVKIVDFTGGTGRRSTGYQSSTWVATATTVTSAAAACV